MRRPEFLLDCDNVMSDFSGAYLRELADLGHVFEKHEWRTYNAEKALGLSREIAVAMNARICEVGFVASMDVLDGAKEGVKLLREVANITVVTAPWTGSRHWDSERRAWLKRHFGFRPEEIIFAWGSRKAQISGDYLLEDKHETVVSWANRNIEGVAMLWDHHHNVHDEWNPRFSDWRRLVEFVHEDWELRQEIV